MSFYKEIIPFIEYVHSIRKLKTYMSFDMVFPTKWTISKSIIDEGEIYNEDTANNQKIQSLNFTAPMVTTKK